MGFSVYGERLGFKDDAHYRGVIVDSEVANDPQSLNRINGTYSHTKNIDDPYERGVIASGEYSDFVHNTPTTVKDINVYLGPNGEPAIEDTDAFLDNAEAMLKSIIDRLGELDVASR
jgi:hypothetical protein